MALPSCGCPLSEPRVASLSRPPSFVQILPFLDTIALPGAVMRGHYKVQGGEVHDVQSCEAAEMQEDLRLVHRAAALPGDAADVAAEVGDSGSFTNLYPPRMHCNSPI